MTNSAFRISLPILLILLAAASFGDEVFRNTDGSKRIHARDRGLDREALVDDSGRVIGYRDATAEDEVVRSPDGSERIYLRDRGQDRQALVDDEGKVNGYRTQTGDDEWRYTEPDGTFLGTEESED